jgi:predicted small lipoprotein YifL
MSSSLASPAARLRLVALAGLLGVGLALAGCGRRGALEPPPDPSAEAQTDETPANPTHRPKSGKSAKTPIVVPNEPFILDPLL